MHRRGGGLRIVLLLAVAVGITAGSGAAAAVLTAEEMGAVKGGCSTLWCKEVDCAAGYETGCWEAHGLCAPGVPYMACDNLKVDPETQLTCVLNAPHYDPCTPGPPRACGPIKQCHCLWFGYGYECEFSLTGYYNGVYTDCPR